MNRRSAPSADPAHPSGIEPALVAKVVARRGRLHAFETLDAAHTALVVIDLHTASFERDDACLAVIEPVNRVAAAVRAAGGTVAWVVPGGDGLPHPHAAATAGAERARMFTEEARPGSESAALWTGLEVVTGDVHATKQGASAFFPGRADLHPQLDALGIDTVLIAGTVTNVCCESSARDATELGYRVVMISDACAGHSYGLHEASLATFFRTFGDVRPSTEIVELLSAGHRLNE